MAAVHRSLARIATFVFFLAMLAFTARYALALPYWDQWKFVPVLDRFFGGRITFHDLWAQHNAHRIVFPRLVMLMLARLTGWNIAWEIGANLVLASTIFMLFVRSAQQRLALPVLAHVWIAPPIALLIFSLAQWQNLVWGWQIQVFMNVTAAVAGLLVLTSHPLTPSRFLAAVALGIVATFSFASGLAYWFAGLCAVPWVTPRPVRWFAAWIAVTAAVIALYLHGFEVPSSHSEPTDALDRLGTFAGYVFTFIGGAVLSVSNPYHAPTWPSLMVGLAAVASLVGMVVYAARRKEIVRITPWIAIAIYVLGSAAITGLGRLDEGSAQALASRYTTVAAPFWAAWLLLAIHTATTAGSRSRAPIAMAIAVVLVTAACNSARGAHAGSQRCRHVLAAKDALIHSGDDDLLQRIYPRPEELRELQPLLRQRRLSIFRD